MEASARVRPDADRRRRVPPVEGSLVVDFEIAPRRGDVHEIVTLREERKSSLKSPHRLLEHLFGSGFATQLGS